MLLILNISSPDLYQISTIHDCFRKETTENFLRFNKLNGYQWSELLNRIVAVQVSDTRDAE